MTKISQLSFKIPQDTFPALEQKLLLNKNKGDSKKKKSTSWKFFWILQMLKLQCVFMGMCVHMKTIEFFMQKNKIKFSLNISEPQKYKKIKRHVS